MGRINRFSARSSDPRVWIKTTCGIAGSFNLSSSSSFFKCQNSRKMHPLKNTKFTLSGFYGCGDEVIPDFAIGWQQSTGESAKLTRRGTKRRFSITPAESCATGLNWTKVLHLPVNQVRVRFYTLQSDVSDNHGLSLELKLRSCH